MKMGLVRIRSEKRGAGLSDAHPFRAFLGSHRQDLGSCMSNFPMLPRGPCLMATVSSLLMVSSEPLEKCGVCSFINSWIRVVMMEFQLLTVTGDIFLGI